MRELLAKAFAVGLTVLMIGLAGAFAARQNTGAPPVGAGPGASVPGTAAPAAPAAPVPPPPTPPSAAVLARGGAVFEEQGCTRCHRLDGVGSPRSPLDGVGARLEPDRIRAFIVADSGAEATLSPSVVRAKERYRALAADDLDALVAFLAASRDGGGG